MTPSQPTVRHISDVPGNPVERSRGASIQVLIGPAQGAPRFYTRMFTIDPGGRIPEHRHANVEHEQVVVEGELVIGLSGREHVVRAGDTLFIPAGVAHYYENRTQSVARFICVVPRADDYETEWLEDAAA